MDEKSRKPPLQFELGHLFRWMTALAATAAIFAWLKPYTAVGVDPTVSELPYFAIALSALALAMFLSTNRNKSLRSPLNRDDADRQSSSDARHSRGEHDASNNRDSAD
jgi:hypothetical protein